MAELIDVPPALAGVAAADTEIGDVLGQEGYYHYRGRPAPDLARTSTFEAVAALVLSDSDAPLAGDRSLPASLTELLPHLDVRTGLSALGAALGLQPLTTIDREEQTGNAVRLISAFPTLVASIYHGRPVNPDPDLGHAADFLRMMIGAEQSRETVAALEAYLILTIDHGFNNSTFTARVVGSTGTDLGACAVAGFCSLSGPRHGANQERILDMLDGIATPDNAERWMQNEIAERRRLQGFGHAVYRKPDPRLTVLREVGAVVAPERHRLAMAAEEAGTRLLAGRRLVPNVDLHAAVVLEGCGIPRAWFTATFAMARVVGWCAHAIEQANEPKVIRPSARYVGPPPEDDLY